MKNVLSNDEHQLDQSAKANKTRIDTSRRNLLKGATCLGAASFAPTVFGGAMFGESPSPSLSGNLISNGKYQFNTLVLQNRTDKTIVVNNFSNSAFMFDGTVVNCNEACAEKTITIPPRQIVNVQFEKRAQFTLASNEEDYNRIQSRVTRLNDGTRVIPFTATVDNYQAKIA